MALPLLIPPFESTITPPFCWSLASVACALFAAVSSPLACFPLFAFDALLPALFLPSFCAGWLLSALFLPLFWSGLLPSASSLPSFWSGLLLLVSFLPSFWPGLLLLVSFLPSFWPELLLWESSLSLFGWLSSFVTNVYVSALSLPFLLRKSSISSEV